MVSIGADSTSLAGPALTEHVVNADLAIEPQPLSTEAFGCLVLICGLPGCGKTTLCREMIVRFQKDPGLLGRPADCVHVCYDSIESELRGDVGVFDPDSWRAARTQAVERVGAILDHADRASRHAVILLDDNMYYRSMRKRWFQFARERQCGFRQVFVSASTETCLARNNARDSNARVPEFSLRHMSESFEWPLEGGSCFESRSLTTFVIDSSELDTRGQVDHLLQQWRAPGFEEGFWSPPAPLNHEDAILGAQEQSEANLCDVALRRIVARALAEAGPSLGPARSVLAKGWGSRKSALVKRFSIDVKAEGACVMDMIHEVEGVFLSACAADVRKALNASSPKELS